MLQQLRFTGLNEHMLFCMDRGKGGKSERGERERWESKDEDEDKYEWMDEMKCYVLLKRSETWPTPTKDKIILIFTSVVTIHFEIFLPPLSSLNLFSSLIFLPPPWERKGKGETKVSPKKGEDAN